MSIIKKNDGYFGKYMAYIHFTELNTTDFEILEWQVGNENYLYEEALREFFALEDILNTKKREAALAAIDETHTKFINKARKCIDDFVEIYKKTRTEWHNIQPNYKWNIEEKEYNYIIVQYVIQISYSIQFVICFFKNFVKFIIRSTY